MRLFGSPMKRLSALLRGVDGILFGSAITLWRANRSLEAKINAAEDEPENVSNCDWLQHDLETLKSTLAESVERIERIEDKARGTLIGVAVAVAVLGAAVGIVGPEGALQYGTACLRLVVSGLLIAAIVFPIGSGQLALHAYKTGKIYRPDLSDRLPLVSSEAETKMITLYCIEQNWRAGTLRSNLLTGSFTFLRNGLGIVLILVIVVITSAARAPGKDHNKPLNDCKSAPAVAVPEEKTPETIEATGKASGDAELELAPAGAIAPQVK